MSDKQLKEALMLEFMDIKRFCLWLQSELAQGTKLVARETDRAVTISNCELILNSYRPNYVADMIHNEIWEAAHPAIDQRIMEMCVRSANVACFCETEYTEIYHPPI